MIETSAAGAAVPVLVAELLPGVVSVGEVTVAVLASGPVNPAGTPPVSVMVTERAGGEVTEGAGDDVAGGDRCTARWR